MSSKFMRIAVAVAAGLGGLSLAASARAQTCDRACLIGVADQYLAALVAHDPAKTPTG